MPGKTQKNNKKNCENPGGVSVGLENINASLFLLFVDGVIFLVLCLKVLFSRVQGVDNWFLLLLVIKIILQKDEERPGRETTIQVHEQF